MYIYSMVLSLVASIFSIYLLKDLLGFITGLLLFVSVFLGGMSVSSLCELFRSHYREKIPQNSFILYFIDYGIYACSILLSTGVSLFVGTIGALGARMAMLNVNGSAILFFWTVLNIVFSFTFTMIAYKEETLNTLVVVNKNVKENIEKIQNNTVKQEQCPKCGLVKEKGIKICKKCDEKNIEIKE